MFVTRLVFSVCVKDTVQLLYISISINFLVEKLSDQLQHLEQGLNSAQI